MTTIANYMEMQRAWSQSPEPYKREAAPRIGVVALLGVELSELFQATIALPTVVAVRAGIAIGTKIYHRSIYATSVWEQAWSPLDAIARVMRVFLAILSTLVFGLIAPNWNYVIHEKLRLTSKYLEPAVVFNPVPPPPPAGAPAATTPA